MIFLGRIFVKVVLLDIKYFGKQNRSCPHVGILRMVGELEFLHLVFRVIVDHHPQGAQDAHHSGGTVIEILADAMLQQ